jgi:hypothetical protein
MTPTDHPVLHKDVHDGVGDHEHADINIRTIVISGIVLAIVTSTAALAMWGVFQVLERQAEARDPKVSPLSQPAGELPPLPRLQTNEPAGLAKFHESEAKTLEGYGWVDEKNGVAHIPIDEAKKKLLEHGLPTRAGAPIDERLGTHAPAMGEASGGRNIPVGKK